MPWNGSFFRFCHSDAPKNLVSQNVSQNKFCVPPHLNNVENYRLEELLFDFAVTTF